MSKHIVAPGGDGDEDLGHGGHKKRSGYKERGNRDRRPSTPDGRAVGWLIGDTHPVPAIPRHVPTSATTITPKPVPVATPAPATPILHAGTVKWFNPEKGFGFILPENGGQDFFVHITAVQEAGRETLQAGERIKFVLTAGRKGKQAASGLKFPQ